MCLRFVFLLITRVAAWLRLSQREEAWQTAAILILRRQLAVLQRRQPRRPNLTWADQALLATLLSVIPKARRQGLRLLITPDTILRRHHDIVRRRRAARSACGRTRRPAAPSGHWSAGWPVRTPAGGIPGSTASSPAWEVKVAASTIWEILKASGTTPADGRPGRPGHNSRAPRPGRSWPAASSPSTCSTVRMPASWPSPSTQPGASESPASPSIPPGNGHPAGPQPGDGPWRASAPGQGHDPRPRIKRHRRIRRHPRRHPDRALQHPGAPHERDHRTLDRRMPTRTPRPAPSSATSPICGRS
jgi:hypothetical protein